MSKVRRFRLFDSDTGDEIGELNSCYCAHFLKITEYMTVTHQHTDPSTTNIKY